MDKQLVINLLDDTLTPGRAHRHDVLAVTKYWIYSKTAILDRETLRRNFPNEISKCYTVDRISTDLYVRLMQTNIVMHISSNMPDLSGVALECQLSPTSTTWKELIRIACIKCIKFQQFYVGVNKLYVKGILVALKSIVHDGKMELHIYFDENDICDYEDYIISQHGR